MVCFYRYAASANRSDEATLSLVCYSRTGQRFFSQTNEKIPVLLVRVDLPSASQVGPLSCILVLPERVSELCLGSQRDLLPAPRALSHLCRRPLFLTASVLGANVDAY